MPLKFGRLRPTAFDHVSADKLQTFKVRRSKCTVTYQQYV